MKNLETIVSLAKRRGFIYPGSDIYGGLANSWDYGPLGVQLKKNIADWWWNRFVEQRSDMVGIDAAILMNPKVWEASGHVSSFNDPLVEDLKTHKRYRADHLLEQTAKVQTDGLSLADITRLLKEHDVKSPDGNDLSAPKTFNLLMKTELGAVEGDKEEVYLRGEIAQAMFVNFKNVLDTTRVRLPFGIASIGKAFRNEITPGNFTFRTLEFDLMEFEYFVRETEWEQQFNYWLQEQQAWLKEMGFTEKNLRIREHTKDELSHYSKRTADIEYQTPFGWKEMFGLAYRTDFDLKNHAKYSGVDLAYTDPKTQEKFYPHAIEPTFGLTRLVLMTLLESYREEGEGKNKRVWLQLHPRLAPHKVAVFPLLANKPDLVTKAKELFDTLSPKFTTLWDDRGNIGKRYYAQDEVGTPFCITVDFDTLEDNTVTVRNRDSATQERIAVDNLHTYLNEKLNN